MIRKGWLGTIGRPDTSMEKAYHIPKDDRESYVTPQRRRLQERIVECEPLDPVDVLIDPELLSE